MITSLLLSAQRKLNKFLQTDTSFIITGSFWTVAARILSSLLLFGISIAYARFITKEAYGTYRFVISFLSLGGFLIFNGITTSFFISASREHENDFRKGMIINFFSSFLISIFGFAVAIYWYIQGNTALFLGFGLASLFTPLEKGTGSFSLWFVLKKQFFLKAFATFSENVFFVFVMGCAILWIYTQHLSPTTTLVVMITAYFFGHGIPSTLFFLYTLRRIPIRPETPVKPHIRYGLHLSSGDIFGSIATYIDGILLYTFLGPLALANYSFAIVGPEQAKGLILTTTSLVAPKIYSKEKKDLIHLPQKLLRLTLFTIIGIVTYIVIAPYIYQTFFPKYIAVANYSRVYAISLLAIPFSAILDMVISSSGKLKNIYVYKITSPVIQTIFLIILIPMFGIWGAILGRMGGKFVDSLLLLYIFKFH